jgi:hypothetical protein
MNEPIVTAANGDRVVSLRWVIGVLLTVTALIATVWITQISSAASQRIAAELIIQQRLNTLEWNQSRVLAILEANRETLQKIYDELKTHRLTGK